MINRAQDKLSAQLHRFPTEEEMANHLEMNITKYRQNLVDVGHSYILSLDNLVSSCDSGDGSLNLLDSLRDENCVDPSDFCERERVREKVREAVDQLPEREKIILTLYYFEDLNMKEIGEVLGISEARVSQLHNSAVTHLKPGLSRSLNKQPA
jgi:RNA polymerase sigma factor for flagellar operon FliA